MMIAPLADSKPTIQLRPYQRAAIDALYHYLRTKDGNPCIVAPTGCHAVDHPILMYDGSVIPVQDVRVGDLLMGPDSQFRRVLQLCRGNDSMYRITPRKGEPFIVNGNHILSLECTNEGRTWPGCKHGGEKESISVVEYLGKSRYWKHLRKLYRVGVDFSTPVDLPIPPYILGILLGDGSLRQGVNLTTADDEMGQYWESYALSLNARIRPKDVGRSCPTYCLVHSKGRPNVLTESLDALELAETTSLTKFVPPMYLRASRCDRLQLLAGLMDTDGHLQGHYFDYITKSPVLAGDIVFLARSLGLAAYSNRKYSACQTGAGGWYYRVHILGDTHLLPTRLPRKRALKLRRKTSVLRTGFQIDPCGEGEFYGFLLSGDHLYLDGNFVVHHNSGKSPMIATICRDAVQKWDGRVLVLAHVKELLEQTVDKLHAVAPDLWNRIGVYSAGLRSRDTEHEIIIAGIQSVYKRAAELGRFDLILIDESHLLSPTDSSMYQQFLRDAKIINPHVRLIGLTATPFRTSTGLIVGPDQLLDEICYEIGIRELIADGYLCPLKSKAGKCKVDTSGLHIRGGEFIAGEVEQLMDEENLVASACREIVEQTANRHSVLIFASGIQHAQHVQKRLESHGCECGFICGETLPFERKETLDRFRNGNLKYLVNVNVLTTGFDAPNIDCVVLLRPTMSPGLFTQMVGRGFRLHPNKSDCLILDFGGNVLRHGPVDAVQIEPKVAGTGDAPAKECPQCQALIAAAYAHCPECGFAFPEPEKKKHEQVATTAGVLTGQVSDTEYDVKGVYYSVHTKRGAPEDHPRSMRVEYCTGFNTYQSEWVCFEHDGFARQKAEAWWRQRSREPVPKSAEQAVDLAERGAVAEPKSITVRYVAGESFPRIIGYQLDAMPPRLDGSDEVEDASVPEYSFAEDEDNIPF